jgi:hypothetical protein
LDIGIEICYDISSPLLAYNKDYNPLQRVLNITPNKFKLFTDQKFCTLFLKIIDILTRDEDKLETSCNKVKMI